MKKINFKNLSNDEILTRDELKRIIGGNGTDDDKEYTFKCGAGEGEDLIEWECTTRNEHGIECVDACVADHEDCNGCSRVIGV